MQSLFPGIDALLTRHRDLVTGRRVGLVTHSAAVDSSGILTAERMWKDPDITLSCILGPEHGYSGAGDAGEAIGHTTHPHWNIPVFSLYGSGRRPTSAMMDELDILVFDLQDLGVRCYTYCSTLRYVLEATALAGKSVIVADRPVPFPRTCDGPMPEEGFESFVCLLPVPMLYGMTPGETARFLARELCLDMNLFVAAMEGFAADEGNATCWPNWTPPSPGIASFQSALCYPITVCFEAITSVDYGRGTGIPFQVVGAPWLKGDDILDALTMQRHPGVRFDAHQYDALTSGGQRRSVTGVRFEVSDPALFQPVRLAVSLVALLQEQYGTERVWSRARESFFDKLFGTDTVRKALLAGEKAEAIADRWKPGLSAFRQSRKDSLLY